ncbi:MAG: T9SS type A sorting domain-containing protein [Candidatus Eisenbacteria bacterium]|nr:T9SS type A sorting domain-containing protein [Candidatus Eisenbacteria bacterium]
MRRSAWSSALLLLGVVALSGAPAVAQHTFDGNIVYGNFPDGCDATEACPGFSSCSLLRDCFTHNDEVDPQLGDPYNLNGNPSWVPALTSPAVGLNDDVVEIVMAEDDCWLGACEYSIPVVCYRGALPPAEWAPQGDWTEGWTYYNYDGTGRDDIDFEKEIEILEGDYADDLYLTTDYNYLARGKVNMLEGTTLYIEAGVVIFGENATAGYIAIERGAQIQAIGRSDAPIILTSDQEPGYYERGGWGGLVIHGRAIANCADCRNGEDCVSEGGAGNFCGDDDCDDSGTVKYLRIEYSGVEISPNNELNCLTMNGLGLGTDISYVQAHMGSDDLFEWFGGKIITHHLVGTWGADDGFDWQMGFRGGCHHGVIQYYTDAGNRGIEADNNEYDFEAECRSNPTMANLTLVGPLGNGGGTSDAGIYLRRGTAATIVNSIIIGWEDHGIKFSTDEPPQCGCNDEPAVACGGPSAVPEPGQISSFMAWAQPNPATTQTQISFYLTEASEAQISMFDAGGRMVDEVLNATLEPGMHNVPWNVPGDLGTGTYYYRVTTNQGVATGRVFTLDQ